MKKTHEQRTVKNATHPLTLFISPAHEERAKCKDPAQCVIAQALADSPLGEVCEGFQVGARCTKVITSDLIVRYRTPYKLANALRTFDLTGEWGLPPGEYTLMPYDGGKRRWEKARRKGGKQDIFHGRRSVPTRRALTVNELKAA